MVAVELGVELERESVCLKGKRVASAWRCSPTEMPVMLAGHDEAVGTSPNPLMVAYVVGT